MGMKVQTSTYIYLLALLPQTAGFSSHTQVLILLIGVRRAWQLWSHLESVSKRDDRRAADHTWDIRLSFKPMSTCTRIRPAQDDCIKIRGFEKWVSRKWWTNEFRDTHYFQTNPYISGKMWRQRILITWRNRWSVREVGALPIGTEVNFAILLSKDCRAMRPWVSLEINWIPRGQVIKRWPKGLVISDWPTERQRHFKSQGILNVKTHHQTSE